MSRKTTAVIFADAAAAFRSDGATLKTATELGCPFAVAETARRAVRKAEKGATVAAPPVTTPAASKPVGYVKAKLRAARAAREAGTTPPADLLVQSARDAGVPDVAAIVAAVLAAMGHSAPVAVAAPVAAPVVKAAPKSKGKAAPPVASDIPELGALTPDEAAECSDEELRELAIGGASAALRSSAADALRLRTEPDVATIAARLQAMELQVNELRSERDAARAEVERLTTPAAKSTTRKARTAATPTVTTPPVKASAAPATNTVRKSRTGAAVPASK